MTHMLVDNFRRGEEIQAHLLKYRGTSQNAWVRQLGGVLRVARGVALSTPVACRRGKCAGSLGLESKDRPPATQSLEFVLPTRVEIEPGAFE